MKLVLTSNVSAFVNSIDVFGRPARLIKDIYVRAQDDSSVTAYEERPLFLENDFIQDQSWANSLAQILIDDYSEPDKIQRLTIRAIPELQRGDLVSWQGRYWRIYGIKARLSPSYGFLQELTLLQRTITSYFRIGISLIGGTDKIAP